MVDDSKDTETIFHTDKTFTENIYNVNWDAKCNEQPYNKDKFLDIFHIQINDGRKARHMNLTADVV